MTKAFVLLNESFQFADNFTRGELKLSIKWIFDSATDDENKKNLLQTPKKGIFGKIKNILSNKKEVKDKIDEV
jgi:hypothetical protein